MTYSLINEPKIKLENDFFFLQKTHVQNGQS